MAQQVLPDVLFLFYQILNSYESSMITTESTSCKTTASTPKMISLLSPPVEINTLPAIRTPPNVLELSASQSKPKAKGMISL